MSAQAKELSPREVIHDLNNLFAALSGFTELLMEDLVAEPELCLLANKIMRAQLRAEKLVAQLSDIVPLD